MEDVVKRFIADAAVRRRFNPHWGSGFFPLSKWAGIPEANAAQREAVEAGVILHFEKQVAGRVSPISGRELQSFRARLGLSSKADRVEAVVLLEDALELLAGIEAFPAQVGIVAPPVYQPLLDEIQQKTSPDREIIRGEKLEELIRKISRLKTEPDKLILWTKQADLPAFLKRQIKSLLNDPHTEVEARALTPAELGWARSLRPDLAEEIEALRRKLEALSVAA